MSKVFAISSEIKNKIFEFLKEKKYQVNIISDMVAPIKFVIRGLPRSMKSKGIAKTLRSGDEVIKAV